MRTNTTVKGRGVVQPSPEDVATVSRLVAQTSVAFAARELQVARATVCSIMEGRRVNHATLSAVLQNIENVDTALRERRATRRRLRALSTVGYSYHRVGQAIGVQHSSLVFINNTGKANTPSNIDAALEQVYESLSMRPTNDMRPRKHAAENGWFGPWAWDDILEDDHPLLGVDTYWRGLDGWTKNRFKAAQKKSWKDQ